MAQGMAGGEFGKSAFEGHVGSPEVPRQRQPNFANGIDEEKRIIFNLLIYI